jgi:hypothetical protein
MSAKNGYPLQIGALFQASRGALQVNDPENETRMVQKRHKKNPLKGG